MDSAHDVMERPAPPPHAADDVHVAAHADEREADALVERLWVVHPELPRESIAALVDEALIELQTARVQAFRAILAERTVRRRLRTGT